MSDNLDDLDDVLDDDLLEEAADGDVEPSTNGSLFDPPDGVGESGSEPDSDESDVDLGFVDQRVDDFGRAVKETEFLGLTKAAIYGTATLPLAMVTPILRPLPASWRLYHKLHKWSAWQMQQSASADALANVRLPNDREEVLPAKYVEGSEDDNDISGWKVKTRGSKRYDTGVLGGASSRFGKADLIHINEDDLEQGTWTEATIDSAFQLDREKYLFRDATIDATANVVGVDPSIDGQPAMADGGSAVNWQPETIDVSLQRPGILEDVLVPITSRSGYDGQVISWNQYSNIKKEKSDQETVRNAKNAGWMAAKLDDIDGFDLFKWVIILGIWSAILLFHNDIGAAISGIGGGDAVGSAADGVGMGLLAAFASIRGGD